MKKLTPTQFRDEVINRAGSVPTNALVRTIDNFIDKKKTGSDDVFPCLELAGQMGRAASKPDQVAWRRQIKPKRGKARRPTQRRDDILEQIEDWVQQLRKTLFGSGEPPFADIDDAARWLKKRSASIKQQNKAWQAVAQDLNRLDALAHRINAQDPFTWMTCEEEVPGIGLAGKGGQEFFVIKNNDPLWRASDAVERVSHVTGLSKAELTTYVLTGKPPSPAPIYVDMIPGRTLAPDPALPDMRLRIELDAEDLTRPQFLEVLRQIRRWLGLARKRGVTSRDRKLITVVRSLGGQPTIKPNSKLFWEKVRKDRRLGQRFTTHAAAREAYRRAATREAEVKTKSRLSLLRHSAKDSAPEKERMLKF